MAHVTSIKELRELIHEMEEFRCEFPPEELFNAKNELYEAGDERARFFTESFLYPLLGKDDARSVLSLFKRLKRAIGEGT